MLSSQKGQNVVKYTVAKMSLSSQAHISEETTRSQGGNDRDTFRTNGYLLSTGVSGSLGVVSSRGHDLAPGSRAACIQTPSSC